MAEGKDAPVVTDGGHDEETKLLNLNIKTTKKKESIQVPTTCTVAQVSMTVAINLAVQYIASELFRLCVCVSSWRSYSVRKWMLQ